MAKHRRVKVRPYRNAVVCTTAAGGLVLNVVPADAGSVVAPGAAAAVAAGALAPVEAVPVPVQAAPARVVGDKRTRNAVGFATKQVRNANDEWFYSCQRFVRTALGLKADAGSAIASWRETPARYRHTSANPPAGVPVYWAPNHVALSAGHGMVYSNDIKHRGKVNLVPAALIEKKWGAKRLGWATWMNGVVLHPTVVTPAPTATTPDLDTPL